MKAHEQKNLLKISKAVKKNLAQEVISTEASIADLRSKLSEIKNMRPQHQDIFTPKTPMHFSYDILPPTPDFHFPDDATGTDGGEIFVFNRDDTPTPEVKRSTRNKSEIDR